MSAFAMANTGRTWNSIVKQRRKRAIFKVYLTVRGKEIVKQFTDEIELLKWKSAYESHMRDTRNGIESLRVEVLYL